MVCRNEGSRGPVAGSPFDDGQIRVLLGPLGQARSRRHLRKNLCNLHRRNATMTQSLQATGWEPAAAQVPAAQVTEHFRQSRHGGPCP